MGISIVAIFQQFNLATSTYVYNGYNALVYNLHPIMASLVILAIVYRGYEMWFRAKIDATELAYFVIKISVLYMIGFNWATFSENFIGLFNSIINDFSSALLEANPIANIPSQYTSLDMALQLVCNLIFEVAQAITSGAHWYDVGLYFDSFAVMIIGFIMIAIAMVELIISKFLLAVLFTIAPLMFVGLLFPYTKKIFDKWLGNIVGLTMVFIMISATLGMLIGIIYTFIPMHLLANTIDASAISGLGFSIWPMIICLVICIYAMTKVTGIAMSIGGGAAESGVGGVVGGMMVGAAMMSGGQALQRGRQIYGNGLQKLKDYGKDKSRAKSR